jgi:hypothetical protein
MYWAITHQGQLLAKVQRTGFGNRFRPYKWRLELKGDPMPQYLDTLGQALAIAQVKFPNCPVQKFNARGELIGCME